MNEQVMSGLAEGRRLFEERRYEESERYYVALLDTPVKPDALYGLGMVRLALGDERSAAWRFEEATRLNGRNANALYQLGVIAERRGNLDEARTRYVAALTSQPEHVSARRNLHRVEAILATRSVGPDQRDLVGGGDNRPSMTLPTTQGYGVYDYLLADPAPLSRKTITVIDALRMKTGVSLSAYALKIGLLLALGIPTWIIASFLTSLRICLPTQGIGTPCDSVSSPFGTIALLIVLAWLSALTLYWARISSISVTIDKARIQIQQGILFKRLQNIELWRVHNIELRRDAVNQLTGDGSLHFELTDKKAVTITGLAKGRKLDEIYQQLLNLVFLVRSNAAIKGIIQ